MKLAVTFDFKEGMSKDRAHNLALAIATMVNASVRGEPDVTADIDPQWSFALPHGLASVLKDQT